MDKLLLLWTAAKYAELNNRNITRFDVILVRFSGTTLRHWPISLAFPIETQN
jgi:hypothetical protein